jgi:uncharacterized BrkB/YihY/UPF0761 family membrane protein
MKAILILLNWLISFMAIGAVDTEYAPLGAVLIIFLWFAISSLILIHADRTGAMKQLNKYFKEMEE